MKRQRELAHSDCEDAAMAIAAEIRADRYQRSLKNPVRLYGVPRGGVPAMYLVIAALRNIATDVCVDSQDAEWIIDDIIDSGATRDRFMLSNPRAKFRALFTAGLTTTDWLVFPWERGTAGSDESATDIPIRLLQYIGENPEREGLKDTPKRFLSAWKEYTAGYEQNPSDVVKAFEDGAQNVDEMVLVRDIPIYSHCEHHLAPFFGVAHIAYIPDGRVLGLSKFARLANIYARRLQVQERLTQQIAYALAGALKPKGVGVVLECRHLCMEQRGIKAQGSSTTTSCLIGALKEKDSARAEFLRLVR